ncbi:pimeloyl-ACP methyl ester carboxylesterase [Chitinophaga terrae (ex Kim and Jung 2007)]|uniref:alpha/beta fold hydrolase n=1 Tax=Chitinophaga terrae (ex Kim and Jung 2007) TaxID=408074 RepID=UPI002782C6BE|nr:alpha/beta fold hydrolase [Chitinophaga terrae (ex Kim and Jung 2007)]MDQ0109477.1 pimeloyl-ACP methyl ester carboxylesterase [Chitinophaga terrae (ex Kim and Jung 2007)]
MKKTSLLLVLVISFTTLFARQKDTVATRFFDHISKQQWTSAINMMDATMRQNISAQQLETIWGQLQQQYGKWKSFDKNEVTNVQGYKVVLATNTFDRARIVFRLALDKENKIAGFFVDGVTPNAPKLKEGESSDSVKTEGGTLYGTLLAPPGGASCPVMLILVGSGPIDRDGDNSIVRAWDRKTYALLAESLAAQGIATLRYDKRWIGQSQPFSKPHSQITFSDYKQDAGAWIKHLRNNKRFSKVGVLGHSEGGVIGIMLASAEPLDKLVLLATPAESVDKIVTEQLKSRLPDSLLQTVPAMFRQLAAGGRPEVPQVLQWLFNDSNFALWRSAMEVTPCDLLAKVQHTPVLIINGTADVQVPGRQAEMLHECLPSSELVLLKDVTHMLRPSQAPHGSDPNPLDPNILPAVAAFVKK